MDVVRFAELEDRFHIRSSIYVSERIVRVANEDATDSTRRAVYRLFITSNDLFRVLGQVGPLDFDELTIISQMSGVSKPGPKRSVYQEAFVLITNRMDEAVQCQAGAPLSHNVIG